MNIRTSSFSKRHTDFVIWLKKKKAFWHSEDKVRKDFNFNENTFN